MWKRLLLLALALVASADEAAGSQCCLPSEWEGYEGVMAGVAKGANTTYIQGSAAVAYSYSKRKININENIKVDGKPISLRFIMDYKQHKTYMIRGQTCRTYPLREDMFKCIPNNASHIGDYYYGGPSDKLLASGYMMMMKQQVYVTLSVTKNGCIPIAEVIVAWNSGGAALSTIGYVNIVLGIKDPSVFDIPSSCNSLTRMFWVPSKDEFNFERKFRQSVIFRF